MEVFMKFSHSELVEIAGHIMTLPLSQRGLGCPYALLEPRTSDVRGEIPDAWCSTSRMPLHKPACSVVMECKTSREDFDADFNKIWRKYPPYGMGNIRYFVTPEGVITEDLLPRGWGLITINERREFQHVCGLYLLSISRSIEKHENPVWYFDECNQQRELDILTNAYLNCRLR